MSTALARPKAPPKKAPARGGPSGIPAWLAFDFLNSILVINGSVHFSAWLSGPQGVDPRWYGAAFAISGVVLLVLLPVLGAVIDRNRWGRPALLVSSLAIAACAMGITVIGHLPEHGARAFAALAVFALLNVLYQASLVAYNWTVVYLRGVKTADDVRRVSGLGEAAGNAGSVAGALLGVGVLAVLNAMGSADARIDMFAVLGALFLVLFSIDFVALSRGMDDSRAPSVKLRYGRVWSEWLRTLRKEPLLRRFFVAFLIFANATLTVQLYLPIYMQRELGFGPGRSAVAVALGLGAAACGGVLYARIGPRSDVRRTIVAVLSCMAPALAVLAWVRGDVFIGVLVLIGVLCGGLWGASRAYVIELTHRTRLGRSLAFFAVFERSASVLGPLLWAGVMSLPVAEPLRWSVAFSTMAGMVLVGAAVLWSGRRTPRSA
jgi:UMF1 family MFS transporter